MEKGKMAAEPSRELNTHESNAKRCIVNCPFIKAEGNLLLKEPSHVEPSINSSWRSRVDA